MIAGTRGSALAMWQTEHVVRLLGAEVQIETLTTRGDIDRTSKLQGKLEHCDLKLRSDAAVCVVMAAKGYPGKVTSGDVIEGLDAAGQLDGAADVHVFHAGTAARKSGRSPRLSRSPERSRGRAFLSAIRAAYFSNAARYSWARVRSVQ